VVEADGTLFDWATVNGGGAVRLLVLRYGLRAGAERDQFATGDITGWQRIDRAISVLLSVPDGDPGRSGERPGQAPDV
jgi:hypothetical protein